MVGAQGVAKLLEKMVPVSQNGSSRMLQASKQPPECRWEPEPAPRAVARLHMPLVFLLMP